MIRCTKHSLKFSNLGKTDQLSGFFDLYNEQLGFYVEEILSERLPLQSLVSSKILPDGNLGHSWSKQLIFKRAVEIVQCNLALVKRKVFSRYKRVYAKCLKKGIHKNFTDKKFSELTINYLKRVRIDLNSVPILLDQRFVDFEDGSFFDQFVGIRIPYQTNGKWMTRKVNFPFKHHKNSNKFVNDGWKMKKSVQIEKQGNGDYALVVFFEKEKLDSTNSNEIGIDIGYKKLISSSDGKFYGDQLEDIYNKIARKKKDSKNYKQALRQKKNEINRAVNSFLSEHADSDVVCEDLLNVKHKSKFSRKFNNKLQYWSYRQVLDRLVMLSEEKGFLLKRVNPAYTSQTCSACGCVDKSNRKGDVYQCACGLMMDADTNASINILHRGVYSPSAQQITRERCVL